MDPKNGITQGSRAKAKWAGAPNKRGMWELLKITRILAAIFCVPSLVNLAFFLAIFVGVFHSSANAQLVNGDFSAGSTGWTTTAPSGSSLSYAGNQLTAVSDNNGGTNQRTYASQSLTTTDPGFLSYQLVSWTTADYGRYDYPTVRIGGSFFWVTTAGALSGNQNPPSIDNDDAPISVSGVRTLTAGTTTVGFGVTATDSCCGSGTAVWDNIDYQELTQSPGAQVTPFNTALTLSGANAPQVATNSGAVTMTITLSVTNGILNLGSTTGISFSSGGNGTSTMTFSGTVANINNALNNLQYTPTTGYSGASTITFFANGGGLSDTDTIAVTVSPPTYSFTISKVASPTVVTAANDVINYTITVTNTGGGSLTSAVVTDSLDQNGTSTSLTLSGPTGDGGVAGVMEAGEVWVYTASHTVTQAQMDDGNDLVNTVTFNPAEAAASSDSATTTISTSPSLSVNKLAYTGGVGGTLMNGATDNLSVGTVITYEYTITNTGNQTISAISLGDVHGGSGIAPAPNADTATLTDNGTLGDSTNPSTGDGVWDQLAPGDVLTVTSTYTVTQNDVDTLQ